MKEVELLHQNKCILKQIFRKSVFWDKKSVYVLFLRFYMLHITNLFSILLSQLHLVTSHFSIMNNKPSHHSSYFCWAYRSSWNPYSWQKPYVFLRSLALWLVYIVQWGYEQGIAIPCSAFTQQMEIINFLDVREELQRHVYMHNSFFCTFNLYFKERRHRCCEICSSYQKGKTDSQR